MLQKMQERSSLSSLHSRLFTIGSSTFVANSHHLKGRTYPQPASNHRNCAKIPLQSRICDGSALVSPWKQASSMVLGSHPIGQPLFQLFISAPNSDPVQWMVQEAAYFTPHSSGRAIFCRYHHLPAPGHGLNPCFCRGTIWSLAHILSSPFTGEIKIQFLLCGNW